MRKAILLLASITLTESCAAARDCARRDLVIVVYNEAGVRKQVRIESISFLSAESKLAKALPASIQGDTIRGIPGLGTYLVAIKDAENRRTTHHVEAFGLCRQRVSFVLPDQRPAGFIGDIAFNLLRGRLTGCSFQGDWWVRLMPMFGRPAGWDAGVSPDGRFEIPGQIEQGRHMLVVGREGHVIATEPVDLTGSPVESIRDIDISRFCDAKTPNRP